VRELSRIQLQIKEQVKLYELYFQGRHQMAQVSCCLVDWCAPSQEPDQVVEDHCREDREQGVVMEVHSRAEEGEEDTERRALRVEAFADTSLEVGVQDEKHHHGSIFRHKTMERVPLFLYAVHATSQYWFPQGPRSHPQQRMIGPSVPEDLFRSKKHLDFETVPFRLCCNQISLLPWKKWKISGW
jgi:hypothetical protein